MAAMPSNGQKTAKADHEFEDTGVAIGVWIILDYSTRVGARVASMREFPFDTSGATLDLYFNGYGAALKTDATFRAEIDGHATFKSTAADAEVPNAAAATADFAFDTTTYGGASATFAGEGS